MEFLVLIVGLVGLWLGTEAVIRGAVAIAARLHISEFIVGVAILSIGSDLPELTIAVRAALKNLQMGQVSDIVVGSALGSALAQIGFVLGITGLSAYLTLPKRIVYQHGGMLLASLVLLGLFGLDGHVTQTEGVSLIIVYAIYLVFLVTDAMAMRQRSEDHAGVNLAVALVYLIIGLLIVIGSAELTVSSATGLATALNIEQSFIAIIIIGAGSSLPELSISLAAALKRRARMSVGNLIGSNIFDTLIPVGVAAVIVDLEFNADMLRHELPFLFALSVIVLVFFRRKKGIQKREAAIILGLYLGYAVIKIVSL
jgi:cation:H+ antiporter